jgi:hypothetical protein
MKKLLIIIALLAPAAFAAKGDVNKDGKIDINDCKAVAAAVAAGLEQGIALSDGDIDGDGKITILDAMRLHQYLGGVWQDPAGTLAPTPEINEDERAYLARYEALCDGYSAMSPSGFVSGFPMQSDFTGKIPLEKHQYYTQIDTSFKLTSDQKTALSANGFVVLKPIAASESFTNIYGTIFKKDSPVLVTADAILDPLYLGYDDILKTIEKTRLIPAMDMVVKAALSQLSILGGRISSSADSWKTTSNDVEIYLTVALALLHGQQAAAGCSNQAVTDTVNLILSKIAAEKMAEMDLFGNTTSGSAPYTIDFSQFKPRSHYELAPYSSDSSLFRYFKCMMWLGRADCAFNLDSLRNARDFILLHACVEQGGVLPTLAEFNRIVSFFVGDMDNFSVEGMTRFWSEYSPRPALSSVMTDNATAVGVQKALQKKDYGNQFILSQAMWKNSDDSRPSLPKIAQLSGQRFIMDSYLLGHTVEWYVKERNKPMLEEVAFCLGNNAGLNVVKTDVAVYTASTGDYKPLHARLGAARALFDAYPYWDRNLYTIWLDALRELSKALPSTTPQVMRTSQWQNKQMNAQLTSWAQLRHNTLLYAKQSYTGSVTCKYPKGYVEPYPAFYRKIGKIMQGLSIMFGTNQTYQKYFSNWATITDTLAAMADSELAGRELNAQYTGFLNKMVYDNPMEMCGLPPRIGWYPQLYFSNDGAAAKPCIADVHTIPPSEISPSDMVLHAATGCAQTMIVQIATDDTCATLYAGAVGSYYQVDVSPIARKTDSEWSTMFTNSFTANTPISQPAWFEQYRK